MPGLAQVAGSGEAPSWARVPASTPKGTLLGWGLPPGPPALPSCLPQLTFSPHPVQPGSCLPCQGPWGVSLGRQTQLLLPHPTPKDPERPYITPGDSWPEAGGRGHFALSIFNKQ